MLTQAPRDEALIFQQQKTVVGFGRPSILRRSNRAMLRGFSMSGRDGKPSGLPTPQGRSSNPLLPRHPFGRGTLGSSELEEAPMSAQLIHAPAPKPAPPPKPVLEGAT